MAVQHNTTSLPARLSGVEITAVESGCRAPQGLDKCIALSQHNKGKSRSASSSRASALQASAAMLCVDLCTCRKPSVKCSVGSKAIV